MIVFRSPGEVPSGFGPSVVAIGKFDGVHSGHRALIDRARVEAAPSGASVVAVTFDAHPLRTLRPDRAPVELVGPTQKLRLLDRAGVEATLLLHFDATLARMSAEVFIRTVLVDALRAETVFVGADFRFGSGGAGDPMTLVSSGARAGFRVVVVDDVRSMGADRRVSSSWIRELLGEGRVETAAQLLGRLPSVWGEITHSGDHRTAPSFDLSARREGYVPAVGWYAGWLTDQASGLRPGRTYPSVIEVAPPGPHAPPTLVTVRALIIDDEGADLDRHRAEIRFHSRVSTPEAGRGRKGATPPVEVLACARTALAREPW